MVAGHGAGLLLLGLGAEVVYENCDSDADGTWSFAASRPGSRKRRKEVLLRWLFKEFKLCWPSGSPRIIFTE